MWERGALAVQSTNMDAHNAGKQKTKNKKTKRRRKAGYAKHTLDTCAAVI